MAIVTLNKLDAASRQLNTAIAMWFHREDPVSVHTLACASHQVIHDVNVARGGPKLIYDSAWLKDEFRKQAKVYLVREYDFFRHADRSPDAEVEFDEDCTEFFMIMSCYGLNALGGAADVIRSAFCLYFSVRHPDMLTTDGKQFFDSLPVYAIDEVRRLPREQFFQAYKLAHLQ